MEAFVHVSTLIPSQRCVSELRGYTHVLHPKEMERDKDNRYYTVQKAFRKKCLF